VEPLLAFLPFAETDTLAEEIHSALASLAVQAGKPDTALVAALKDKEPLRRAAAGDALTRAGVVQTREDVDLLLKDPNPMVRWRVASALVLAKEREAVPVLIDSIVDVGQGPAWQVQDMLCRLAEGNNPPAVSLGGDETGRKKCRDIWTNWWNKHGKKVDLAVLSQTPPLLGYTTIVLLDQNRVIEVDANNNIRWQIDDLSFPLDIQVLPGDRILVAEYRGGRVTERSFNGEILWQHGFGALQAEGPQVAQRLPNGNTFIAGKYQWIEVDRNGKQVASSNLPGMDGMMKCSKAPNGDVVALLQSGRVIRLDANGKLLKHFHVDFSLPLYGGRIQALPNGNVLIPHHGENKVVEYDKDGKVVWQVKVDQPIVATRLRNGDTLVTSMNRLRAIEFDHDGREVWQFRNPGADVRVTRAIRR
jgi:hypothetical protein